MTQRRPPDTPYIYRLMRDASGQSETFGVILLLAITVVGTTAIITFGSTALTETEDAANLQRTEHTMTLLDSRSAMVALGDSAMQSVQFPNGGDGTFRVDENAGSIRIRHRNFSKSETGVETIYSSDFGTFVYENGDTTLAYQGGGAWRVDEGGAARMVSQPEFHYRGSTLTLPIIRVTGEGEAAGQTTVTVKKGTFKRVFPNPGVAETSPGSTGGNETGAPYDGKNSPDEAYENPIKNGNVTILIQSEYYMGWAEYFRTRTTTDVTVYDSNQTVHIRLESLSDPGAFGSLQNDITIRGMPTAHRISNFSVNLTESGNNKFKQMSWSWYAESGGQKIELYYDSDGTSCEDLRDNNGHANVHIIYKNGTGGHGDETQEWYTDVNSNDALIEDVTCPSNGADSVVVNWTAGKGGTPPGDTMFTYGQLPSNEYNCAAGGGSDPSHELGDELSGCSNGEGPGTAIFDQHAIDTNEGICAPSNPCDVNDGETVNSSFLVNHYMALMGPNYEMKGEQHSNDRLDEEESSGGLYFTQSGARFLQYLHVSENEVEFELN